MLKDCICDPSAATVSAGDPLSAVNIELIHFQYVLIDRQIIACCTQMI